MEILFFAALMVYFSAMLLQFVSVGLKKNDISKIARLLYIAAFCLHTAYTVWRGFAAGRLPLANQFEFASGFTWAAALLGLGGSPGPVA